MKIAYITTNEGRYLEALLDRGFEVNIVITNSPRSKVIEFCEVNDVNWKVIDHADFANREAHDLAVKEALDTVESDLVVLGGYRRLIKNKKFLEAYGGKMVNIHNSFLPNFPGAKAHELAFNSKIDRSGYTIHYVDELMDRGEIVLQEEINIADCQSAQEVYDKLVVAGCLGITRVVEKKTLKQPISRNR